MDKIRIDFFDILGYIIPGSALLIVLWVAADKQVCSVWHVYHSIHSLDDKALLLGLFFSYFSGFILHALGSYIFNPYVKQFPVKYTQPPQLIQSSTHAWTYIREHGEKHIHLLERWYALRAFSQNLSAISLIGFFVSLIKCFQFGYLEWLGVAIIMIISFLFFMERAKIFHKVLHEDMDAVLKELNGGG